MTAEPRHPAQAFSAITIRSPMISDGEAKDQDRVHWSMPMSTACVCDGVSSSPHSAKAAEICAQSSPILFKSEKRLEANLGALADLLAVHKSEALLAPVRTPPDASAGMRAMLTEVVQENMAHGFQTTLVASSFCHADDAIVASVVSVGDSSFFAFSADGQLLATSLPSSMGQDDDDYDTECRPGYVRWGPGDEILAKFLFDATEKPALADRVGIPLGSAGNWLVCIPLDQTPKTGVCGSGRPALWLRRTDLLFVPRYHASAPHDQRYWRYRKIRYSQGIRVLGRPHNPQPVMQGKTNVTAVMPDHFYSGHWQHFQDRFPVDAQFVLASDGFYSCFSTPRELWLWLNNNLEELKRDPDREAALEELHRRLRQFSVDDDISFVWVEGARPCEPCE